MMRRRFLLVVMTLLWACSPTPVAVPSSSDITPPSADRSAPVARPTPSVGPPAATATFARDDLASRVRSLAPAGWRRLPTTLVLSVSAGPDATTVVAVPVGAPSATPTDLVTLTGTVSQWVARADGAIVTALRTSADSSRLAIWSPASAIARWLTPDDPGTFLVSPVWSADGTRVYYGGSRASTDLGFLSIREDGTGAVQIYVPDKGGELVHTTPDGKGLVWSRGGAGGSIDVVDIASGVNRSFGGNAFSTREAWRIARPRALVVSGTCCAGIPMGEVDLWDDIGGTSSVVVGPRASPPLGALGAVWDVSGTRIALTAVEALANGSYRTSLVLTDEAGQHRTAIPGTEDLRVIAWLDQGILAVRAPVRAPASDVLLVQPETGAMSLLYRLTVGSDIQVLRASR